MGCGGSILSYLLYSKKERKQKVINNYVIHDDHSVEITDSIVHRSNVGDQMRICPFCGKRLDVNGRINFCPYCEKRLR